MWMIVLYFLGYFHRNKQNSYVALNSFCQFVVFTLLTPGYFFSFLFSRNENLMLFTPSAGIGFIRQNLTSIDVKFWRLTSIPALKELTKL